MIFGRDFVWLHFPKCAGTRIEEIFRHYFRDERGIWQDEFHIESNPTVSWHDSLHVRSRRDPGFSWSDKTIICSFRRLPSWLASRYNFEARRSPHLGHDPNLLLEGKFLEASGMLNHADACARRYIPPVLLHSDQLRFIRIEHLERDFRSEFGRFLDVSHVPSSEFRAKSNSSTSRIPEDVHHRLNAGNGEVYRSCPYWAEVERKAYDPALK